MSINEIKGLTKYLTEEEIEKIKKEIKDKESILKSGSLDEEEMVQVLNTLFAVLVIEKTLESEIEEVEEIRAELEAELLECYEVYDTYMSKFRKEDKKKKKKNWLLNFLGLSEDISKRKSDIRASDKAINNMKKELNSLKQQKSDENLREVVSKQKENSVRDFCDHNTRDRKPPRSYCPECHQERRRIAGKPPRGYDNEGNRGRRADRNTPTAGSTGGGDREANKGKGRIEGRNAPRPGFNSSVVRTK